MAFLKYARATLQKPDIKFAEWDILRRNAVIPAPDFQKKTAQIILQEYDPSKYMLSHATIVASVDVENSLAPLGRHFIDGFEIDRKYSDYYITPNTVNFINNNNDSFERKLLLTTFKTFIGAFSYVEHVQIPELSRGRIIDAAARDVGDSIYIDILIANELKHASLIRAIKNGQLGTLSMGCSTATTTCTKCGNVALDETQLCNCVKFFKGQEFVNELGHKTKTAELCGNFRDPSSVRFIEASWVANPAFRGAVLRSILSAEEIQEVEDKMHMAFTLPPPVVDPNAMLKAAYQKWADDPPSESGPTPEQSKEEDPIQKAVADLTNTLREQVIERVRKEISKGEVNAVRDANPNKQNESLIRSAIQQPKWRKVANLVFSFVGKSKEGKRVLYGLILHNHGGWPLVKKAGFNGREILAVSRVLDLMTKKSSIAGEKRVYRTVLSVGGTGPYEDVETYLAACRQVLGGRVTGNEAAQLLEKGRLYALGRS